MFTRVMQGLDDLISEFGGIRATLDQLVKETQKSNTLLMNLAKVFTIQTVVLGHASFLYYVSNFFDPMRGLPPEVRKEIADSIALIRRLTAFTLEKEEGKNGKKEI